MKKSQVPLDIVAGITLAALAIPEVLGYTKIAGTPVVTGLYTMLIPMVLYAFFGSSRHLVVAADSATAAILAASLAGTVVPESPEWVAQAGVLALLSAGFLILARVARLGFLADFLSRTVLIGFLTGIGFQVALGQLADMFGIPKAGNDTVHKLLNIGENVAQTNPYALGISVATLAVIIGAKKLSPKVPGPLIAVAVAIVAGWAFHLETYGVQLLGVIPGGVPKLGLPDVAWSWNLIDRLLPTAFAMFVVILAQSAATSRAFAAVHGERFDENKDLAGLALANIGAGLSGAFVVNGSPTKTQMVESAGGRSQISHLSAVFIVLLVLLFLTGPLAYLPGAALATIIFLIGVELVDLKGMRRIFATRRSEFWIALITALVVIFVGVEQSIILAITLSLVDHTRQGYQPHNSVIVMDRKHGLRSQPVSQPEEIMPGLVVYRFSHSIYYANTERLFNEVVELSRMTHPPLEWFCIDAAAIDDVDFTGAATLRSLHELLNKAGIRLVFSQVSRHVMKLMDRYELTSLLGADAFYETIGHAVHAYNKKA